MHRDQGIDRRRVGATRTWTAALMVVTAVLSTALPAHAQYAQRPAPRFEATLRTAAPPGTEDDAGALDGATPKAAPGLWQDPAATPGFGVAFTIEAMGAFAGSLAGFGIGVAIMGAEGCGEDIKCLFERLAGVLGMSAGGAAGGAYGAGKLRGTDPSGWGAIVGSVGGVAAGLATDHLIAEDLDITRDSTLRVLAYGTTHAVITALGSRIGAALR